MLPVLEPLMLSNPGKRGSIHGVAEEILAFAAALQRPLEVDPPDDYRTWMALQRTVLGLESFAWPGRQCPGRPADGDSGDSGPTFFYAVQAGFALVCHALVAESIGRLTSVEDSWFTSPLGNRIVLSPAHRFFTQSWAINPNASDRLVQRTTAFRNVVRQEGNRAQRLSGLYQDLFPPTVRRRLGEFHTPAELANWLVTQIEYLSDNNRDRICDPACGCGVFLEQAITRWRLAWPNALDQMLASIVGLEVNPVSLIGAWTTYALAVADLIQNVRSPVQLPLFMVDSWTLPCGIEDAARRKRIATAEEQGIWRLLVEEHQRFETFVPFDFMVGNPAWMNWEDVAIEVRRNLADRIRHYGLISGLAAVGAIKVDLSGLSLLIAADKLLANGGVLGYVITQAALKANAMSGMRRFTLPDGTRLRPIVAHDFSTVPMFQGASTRTAVLVLRKGQSPAYPVPTIHWTRRASNGRHRQASAGGAGKRPEEERAGYNEEPLTLQARRFASIPLGQDRASPWVSIPQPLVDVLRGFIGQPSTYRPRLGINAGGGSCIFWGRVNAMDGCVFFKNEHDAGRINGPLVGWVSIERGLLYPLIKGRDVHRWQVAATDRVILVPHTIESGMHPLSEDQLLSQFPGAWSFLNRQDVRRLLESRRALRRWAGGQFKWYSLFEIGPYTFAPYKVAYRGQVATDFVAAVIDDCHHQQLGTRPVMPDQTVHFVPCQSPAEAHYVSGLLNSSFVRLLYRCLNYKHPGTFFVRALRIPEFVPTNSEHAGLAAAASNIASAIGRTTLSELAKQERECDEWVARMYGVSDNALHAVWEELDCR